MSPDALYILTNCLQRRHLTWRTFVTFHHNYGSPWMNKMNIIIKIWIISKLWIGSFLKGFKWWPPPLFDWKRYRRRRFLGRKDSLEQAWLETFVMLHCKECLWLHKEEEENLVSDSMLMLMLSDDPHIPKISYSSRHDVLHADELSNCFWTFVARGQANTKYSRDNTESHGQSATTQCAIPCTQMNDLLYTANANLWSFSEPGKELSKETQLGG